MTHTHMGDSWVLPISRDHMARESKRNRKGMFQQLGGETKQIWHLDKRPDMQN